ncbi:MAG: HEAT repeat domain-containing protein [Chloroflexota bacterium]|nr:HEAT repeat domain-containing protein [Chloroflexota bacterium]
MAAPMDMWDRALEAKLNRRVDAGHLRDLLCGRERIHAASLPDFSDLSAEVVLELRAIWPEVPVQRRRALLASLRELADDNLEYNFKHIYLVALQDEDEAVRAAAVEGLWEEDSTLVLHSLEGLALTDSSADVRASAAAALGRFVYRAAVGDMSAADTDHLQELLRRLVQEAPDGSDLQMRSAESLAYLGSDSVLDECISRLYYDGGEDEQASALTAMGRTMDPRWKPTVLEELDSPSPRLQFHAARAAGEMGLEEAVQRLAQLIAGSDRELQHTAVWALGQIGDRTSTKLLESLLETPDEGLREAAEDALNEAAYSGPLE